MKDKREALQKIISQNGYCSRRKAEKLIQEKRVKVNDRVAELGDKANFEKDDIKIDNKNLDKKTQKIYLKLYKPQGYTCTNKKFSGEKNVFDLVNLKTKLFVAGRLDKNSEGLVILTNDGYFTQKITHPSFDHKKKYLVKVKNQKEKTSFQELQKSFLEGIKDGREILKAKDIDRQKENLFYITLTQGKNRQIRRMFEKMDYQIIFLKRISIADIKLGNLSKGEWKYFNPQTKI